ncbi:DMT family transporter [Sulfitobacter sp. LCG007]
MAIAHPDSTTFLNRTGVALVVVSACVFSTAGIFTRGVSTAAWDVIFWRGLAAALFTIFYLVSRGSLLSEIRAFGRPALLVTFLMAAGTAAFIPAFKLSSVANVALIYSAAPFLAAALSWIFIRETPSRRVLTASIASLLGVLLIVSDSLGEARLAGDLLAMLMTLCMAGVMVTYRARPETTAALPAALSSVLLVPVALLFGQPLEVAQGELPVLVLFGLVFAIASVTLSEGARRLPSAETALLSSLEMPLAPILAWLVLAEQPSSRVMVGGLVVFLAVVLSQRRKRAV